MRRGGIGEKFHVTTSAEPGTEIGVFMKDRYSQQSRTSNAELEKTSERNGFGIYPSQSGGVNVQQERRGRFSPIDVLIHRHSRGRRRVHAVCGWRVVGPLMRKATGVPSEPASTKF